MVSQPRPNDPTRKRRRHPGGHIELPINLDEDPRYLALGPLGFTLLASAMARSARTLTDGYISPAAFKSLTADAPYTRRVREDVARKLDAWGFWVRIPGGGYRILDFDRFAMPAAEVAAFRAGQAAKAQLGGQARAAADPPRDRGRFVIDAGPNQPTHRPEHQPDGLDNDQPVSQPPDEPGASPDTDADTGVDAVLEEAAPLPNLHPHSSTAQRAEEDRGKSSYPSTGSESLVGFQRGALPPSALPVSSILSPSANERTARNAGIRTGRRGKRYDPTWAPHSAPIERAWDRPELSLFREAWEARGFRRPPTERQWPYLRGVNYLDPEALATLVRDAPQGAQSNDVIKDVLRHINAAPRLKAMLAAGREGVPKGWTPPPEQDEVPEDLLMYNAGWEREPLAADP